MGAADWPKHENKEWQRAIDLAYDLGWPEPHWTSSHPTLVMKCPADNTSCNTTAFGTGRGTESAAKTALRKIRRCPHRDISQPLVKVDEALETAERLIKGAEKLLRRGDAAARIEELLDLAGSAFEQAEQAIRLEQEFDEADAELEVLTSEAESLVGSDPSTTAVGDVVASAGPHLRRARLELRPLPERAPEVVARQDRLAELVARRDAAAHRT